MKKLSLLFVTFVCLTSCFGFEYLDLSEYPDRSARVKEISVDIADKNGTIVEVGPSELECEYFFDKENSAIYTIEYNDAMQPCYYIEKKYDENLLLITEKVWSSTGTKTYTYKYTDDFKNLEIFCNDKVEVTGKVFTEFGKSTILLNITDEEDSAAIKITTEAKILSFKDFSKIDKAERDTWYIYKNGEPYEGLIYSFVGNTKTRENYYIGEDTPYATEVTIVNEKGLPTRIVSDDGDVENIYYKYDLYGNVVETSYYEEKNSSGFIYNKPEYKIVYDIFYTSKNPIEKPATLYPDD